MPLSLLEERFGVCRGCARRPEKRREKIVRSRRPTSQQSVRSPIQSEVVAGVIEADILNYSTDQVFITRQIAAFHLATQQIAKDATKIFVPRKRHEGAGIRHHTDE